MSIYFFDRLVRMQWDLDQLRQFVAAADHGSISAAARHLGKAQSAVSTAIGLLEADLGIELFDRTQHRATLSEAGELLLLEARELLRQARSLDQRAQSLAAGNEANLALALDEALPYGSIATFFREMSVRFSELELTLLNGTAAEVAEYVEQERAQVAIQLDRGPLSDRFDQCHIGSLQQGIFVSSGHPLLEKEQIMRRDLAHYRQLLMHTDGVQETAYSPKVWRSDSCYSLAEMVADDMGWAILPISVTEYESNAKLLRQLHCSWVTLPQLPVRMLWPQGRQLGPTANWVRQRFSELLAGELTVP